MYRLAPAPFTFTLKSYRSGRPRTEAEARGAPLPTDFLPTSALAIQPPRFSPRPPPPSPLPALRLYHTMATYSAIFLPYRFRFAHRFCPCTLLLLIASPHTSPRGRGGRRERATTTTEPDPALARCRTTAHDLSSQFCPPAVGTDHHVVALVFQYPCHAYRQVCPPVSLMPCPSCSSPPQCAERQSGSHTRKKDVGSCANGPNGPSMSTCLTLGVRSGKRGRGEEGKRL